MLLLVLFCGLLSSIVVVAATALLYIRARHAVLQAPFVLSFAVGTLLASAFLGLLPTATAGASANSIFLTVLIGILLFFALEKLLIWRHCHRADCAIHPASGSLIVIGDAFHNLVDGTMIAAAFLASVSTGVAVTLAVIAHELPQEIGDFGILVHSGSSYRRAFALNAASSATTPLGAIAGYYTLSAFSEAVPYLLALSAASFIYIGTADLIPGLQRETRPRFAAAQVGCLLLGVLVIALLRATMARS